MSDIRLRLVTFLLTEQDRLRNELDEVQMYLDLLDAGAEAPLEPERSKHDSGGGERMQEIAANNQRRILEALGNGHARLTINEIAQRTGMNPSTLKGNLDRLYQAGRVERRPGQRTAEGGRVPYVYELVLTVEQREHTLDLKTRLVDE